MSIQPASPLRYPGGKGCLCGLLADVIDLNDLRGSVYFEPYAGGAGAALELLRKEIVSEVYINDADLRVAAFWEVVLGETGHFVDEIFGVPLSIKEWRRQRDICSNPDAHTRFQTGFSAFYMNRCNRSGVLTGAGPIGGYAQSSKWKLGVRFNREALAERVLTLGRMRERIHVSNSDALDFLRSTLPRGNARKRVLVYLDPPYVNKGQRLYLNSYEARDHMALSRYITEQGTLPWIMSYDDTDLVRQLYAEQQLGKLPIRYSLQDKRKARELLIAPHRLHLPKSRIIFD
ncbi:MAG: DNA adenine methylase [Verrucomicrobia bacterium]|nr:DNA adenine methylase [Verrucomicrobiota bacterium]